MGHIFSLKTNPPRGKSTIPGREFFFLQKSIYSEGKTPRTCFQADKVTVGAGNPFGGGHPRSLRYSIENSTKRTRNGKPSKQNTKTKGTPTHGFETLRGT